MSNLEQGNTRLALILVGLLFWVIALSLVLGVIFTAGGLLGLYG